MKLFLRKKRSTKLHKVIVHRYSRVHTSQLHYFCKQSFRKSYDDILIEPFESSLEEEEEEEGEEDGGWDTIEEPDTIEELETMEEPDTIEEVG